MLGRLKEQLVRQLTPTGPRVNATCFLSASRSSAMERPAKSLVPVPREEARLDPLLGCTIRKTFGGQWFYGQARQGLLGDCREVIAIDADVPWSARSLKKRECEVASGDRAYHIAYEARSHPEPAFASARMETRSI